MSAKILIIDHNDSFTYNLVGLFESFAGDKGIVGSVDVWSVDALPAMDLSDVWHFDAVVLSPGPGLPKDYPVVTALLNECLGDPHKIMPVLGICLGMQTLVSYYGGVLYNLPSIQHGRQVNIWVQPTGTSRGFTLFADLQIPVKAGLYHSWGMDKGLAVKELEVLATAAISRNTASGDAVETVVMAIGHTRLPVYGLQFHPESYMTPEGGRIIRNWLDIIKTFRT